MTDKTPFVGLIRPVFNQLTWHDEVNQNFTTIDALLNGYVGARNVQGVWQPLTAYVEGMILVDQQNGFLYQALVSHTSGNVSFAQDRLDNPTYWKLNTNYGRARGEWEPNGTSYLVGDFIVNTNAHVYAVANTDHTSTASFEDDLANFDVLIDFANDFLSAEANLAQAELYYDDITEIAFNVHNFQWVPNFKWSERAVVDEGVTTTHTIDLSEGSVHQIDLAAETTLSITGLDDLPDPDEYGNFAINFALIVTHNGHCVNWFANVRWPANTAPVQITSGTSVFVFTTVDNGANWLGNVGGTGYVLA